MKFPVFIRFIEQDMQRGYMMLAGFDKKLTRATASRIISLSDISRQYIDKMVLDVKSYYTASEMVDATDSAIGRKIQKLLGEKPTGKLLEVPEMIEVKV